MHFLFLITKYFPGSHTIEIHRICSHTVDPGKSVQVPACMQATEAHKTLLQSWWEACKFNKLLLSWLTTQSARYLDLAFLFTY